MQKTKLIETINKMPEEFSVDDIIERLMVLQKIEEGQEQIKSGNFYSDEEAKAKIIILLGASRDIAPNYSSLHSFFVGMISLCKHNLSVTNFKFILPSFDSPNHTVLVRTSCKIQ